MNNLILGCSGRLNTYLPLLVEQMRLKKSLKNGDTMHIGITR